MAPTKLIRLNVDTGELYSLYHIKKLSLEEIAQYYAVQRHTISRWIRMLGFPLRAFAWHMFGNTWSRGRCFTEKHKKKISEALKGHTGCFKGKKLSPEHRAKVIRTLRNGDECRGEKNPGWKGGVSTLENLGKEYLRRGWCYPIMQRDNFTCQDCGEKQELCTHHLKESFTEIRDKVLTDNPHLNRQIHGDKLKIIQKIVSRHKLEDGITLCQLCHCKRHGRDVSAGRLKIPFALVQNVPTP